MQLNRDLTDLAGAAPAAPTDSEIDPRGLFDPEGGSTVVEPLGSGPGWWAGAPSALWTGERYLLSYRLRRPQPIRGGETHIAAGEDGTSFEVIWSADKEDFDTPSIERSALVRVAEDHWRLYVSYVDRADGRWRIDLLEASAPDAFDPKDRTMALTAAEIGCEGVKDPWVARHGDGWLMLASYAPTPVGVDPEAMHGSRDIYNTGTSKSLTGLALSDDGLTWRWEGPVLEPRDGRWDAYATRLNSVVGTPAGWLGYYDGSASVAENYEERCGVAGSPDLRRWHSLSPDGPLIGASRGPGSVRYVEAVQTADWTRFYYEYTRTDGAHELRTALSNEVLWWS